MPNSPQSNNEGALVKAGQPEAENRPEQTAASRAGEAISKKANTRDEMAFLPAALEVLETPPPPLRRIIALTIGSFFVLAVLWAWLGEVDVVVVAQGKTIPTGKVKVVQPLETAVVRAIYVEEGQRVKASALLIELDPTDPAANVEALQFDLIQSKMELASATALLSENPVESYLPTPDVKTDLAETGRLLLIEMIEKHRASLASVEAEIVRNQAVMEAAKIEQDKLKETIPLVSEQLEAQEKLLKKQLAQKSVVLNLKQQLVEQKAALLNTHQSRIRSQADITALEARRDELIATYRAQAAENQRKALRQITAIEQSLVKEEKRQHYREIRSPVSGVVHELTVHTVGAVVRTADPLMTIVPDDTPLLVEALVLNKDIGFIEEGQATEIKLEAFSFTRYGLLQGTLISLSGDAIIHEQLGPVFKAKVALDSQSFSAKGKEIALTPGMNATAEIKTGGRKILDFFLSPVMRYKDEAIRER